MTELRDEIKGIIEGEDVALFMKGTPQMVMCGNSHRALEALRRAGAPVTAVDILPDPRIREELSAPLGLADDPAGVRRRRAERRRGHRRGAGDERRARARRSPRSSAPDHPRRGRRRTRRGRRLRPRDYNRIVDFETRAIHAGQEPDPATGAVTAPIYQTSTYVAGGGRRPQGLRLLARREPDAHGARGLPRLARGRRARHRLLVRPRRDDDDHAPRSTRASASSP